MPIVRAARRASCRSSIVQQLPNVTSPCCWSYSCIDRPITSWPALANRPAATDESTPPDMATTMRMVVATLSPPHQRPQFRDDGGQLLQQRIDLRLVVIHAEAESNRILRSVRRQSHRAQDVRRLERARGAGGACRHGEPFEVERNEQRLGFDAVERD